MAASNRLLHPSLLSAPSWRTIVRIPHETVATALQLAVKDVEHDVRQQGREDAPNAKGNFAFERTVRYR
jgi:hypothetical protein